MSDYRQVRDAAGNVTSQYGQMLKDLEDDLVKRLRATCICNIDNTPCLAEEECRVAQDAADRIEELEKIKRLLVMDKIELRGELAGVQGKLAKVMEERDEALNQLDSARHSVDVLEKRVDKLLKGQTNG